MADDGRVEPPRGWALVFRPAAPPSSAPRRSFQATDDSGRLPRIGRNFARSGTIGRMRYRVLVELKASRVVTLDAASAEDALTRAADVAFPGRHRRDKVKSLVAPGYPKRDAGPSRDPQVDVPD